MKKAVVSLLCIFLFTSFAGCSNVSQEDYDALKQENSTLKEQSETAKTDYDTLKQQYETEQEEHEGLQKDFDSLQQEYSDYKEKMKPFEELDAAKAEEEKKKLEEESNAEEAVKKIWDFSNGKLASGATRDLYNTALQMVNSLSDGDKKNALMQAVTAADAVFAQQEAEAALGYETGITYDQLARTPNDYIGKKVKFSGKVLQVIEGSGTTIQIRLAVNDNYDTVLLGEYSSSIVASRVLEDDEITVYGISAGTISYKSTMGGTITIPGVAIEKIDQ